MKKNYLMLAAAGLFLFSACSNDEDITKGIETDNSVQELVLKVASSGDGLVTRAGRPLYSSAAAQNIEKVTLIIYDKTDLNAIKKVTSINTWMITSSEYTTNGHGRQHTISFKGDDKLAAGTYSVFATGYTTTGSAYTFNPTLPSSATGNFATQAVTTSDEAEEIFAGEIAELTVNADKSFNVTTGGKENVLTLHRQVAGSFGYFINVPAAVDGRDAASIRLVATGKNLKAKFENFNSAFTDNTSSNIKHIVNGETSATVNAKFAATAATSGADDAHIVYSIALSDWFTAGGTGNKLDSNGDGILNNDDTWKNTALSGYHGVKGAVFAGKFVIPFALAFGENTMELQLLDASGNIIKYWGVSIPSADVATGKSIPEVNDESASIFNVVRNHMYNIGVKISDGTTDPENPTPGTEDPEDLSKGQDIILKVNDNWEALHQLELD